MSAGMRPRGAENTMQCYTKPSQKLQAWSFWHTVCTRRADILYVLYIADVARCLHLPTDKSVGTSHSFGKSGGP